MLVTYLVFAIVMQGEPGRYSPVTRLQTTGIVDCEQRAGIINPVAYPAMLVYCETVEESE